MPASFNKILRRKSFRKFSRYGNVILFVVAIILITKGFVFQLGFITDTFVALKDYFASITIFVQFVDLLITFVTPIGELFSIFTFGIDLSELRPILSPISFLERVVMKVVMYLFILDMRFTFLSHLAKVTKGKLRGIPIESVSKSSYALISIKDVNLKQSLYWLSILSLLTLLILEFLFILIEIVTAIDLNTLLNFGVSLVVWSLVALRILKQWIKK